MDMYDSTLLEQHSWWEIFRWQYGPHRQGLGGILSKLLESSVSWNGRYEAVEAGVIIVLAALLALCMK